MQVYDENDYEDTEAETIAKIKAEHIRATGITCIMFSVGFLCGLAVGSVAQWL